MKLPEFHGTIDFLSGPGIRVSSSAYAYSKSSFVLSPVARPFSRSSGPFDGYPQSHVASRPGRRYPHFQDTGSASQIGSALLSEALEDSLADNSTTSETAAINSTIRSSLYLRSNGSEPFRGVTAMAIRVRSVSGCHAPSR
jgi:hypothetical protein